MAHFQGDDLTVSRRLYAFEAAPVTSGQTVQEEYLEFLIGGGAARFLVRQIQQVLEDGRPWPISFPDPVALLAHLEVLSFRVRCVPRERSMAEERSFWAEYERIWTTHLCERLPRTLRANLVLRIASSVPGVEHHLVEAKERVDGRVQALLAGTLGNGDLITALQTASRMVEDGIDGGVRRLRHMVVVATYREKIQDAKSVLRGLRFTVADPKRFAKRVARAVSASGLVASGVSPLDVFLYWTQYVDGAIDAAAEAVLPSDFA
jgi:hypothetical protein